MAVGVGLFEGVLREQVVIDLPSESRGDQEPSTSSRGEPETSSSRLILSVGSDTYVGIQAFPRCVDSRALSSLLISVSSRHRLLC